MASAHTNSGKAKGEGDQVITVDYDLLLAGLRQEFPDEPSPDQISDELIALVEAQLRLNINDGDMARFLGVPRTTYREWAHSATLPSPDSWKKLRHKIDELIQNGQKEKA